MKLFAQKTDEGLDKLLALLPELVDIVADDRTWEIFDKVSESDEKSVKRADGFKKMIGLANFLLTEYRGNTFRVVGVLNDMTEQEVADQPLGKTLSDIIGIFTDKDFSSFFH
jgi:signal transduction histidine kinase